MARFFIERPVFAWVIAIVIMLAGLLAIRSLPVAQFPEIAPPAVTIQTSYPGANAQTLESTTTQIIEQQMTGLDGMRYMSSSSTSAGTASITLTFETGTDPDTAQVQVQNKLAQATALLPETVQRQGVRVQKSSSSFMMVIALISEDGRLDQADLSDYMNSNLVDTFSRITGVGGVQVFGAQYAMRIWLDPAKLSAFEMTPSDVVSAVSSQNAQISAGAFSGSGVMQVVGSISSSGDLAVTGNVHAAVFYGSGAGITGISSDAVDVTASSGDIAYPIVFTEGAQSDGSLGLGLNTALNYNPNDGLLSSSAGVQFVGAALLGSTLGVTGAVTLEAGSFNKGYRKYSVTTITANTELSASTSKSYQIVSGGTSTLTVILPSASAGQFYQYGIKRHCNMSGNVVIEGGGAELIDGETNVTLSSENAAIFLISDGRIYSKFKHNSTFKFCVLGYVLHSMVYQYHAKLHL